MFDAAEAGTSVDTWSEDDRMRSLEPLDLSMVTGLVVIAAHPDDETLGAGGLIAAALNNALPVTVIIATDGAASEPHESEDQADELRRRRAIEVRSSIRILNPMAKVLLLGLPDGHTRENRDWLRSLLDSHLETLPTGTMAVIPWRGDGHRDHRVVGEVAAEASRAAGLDFIEYPIWMWHWGAPESDAIPWKTMVTLELAEEVQDRKSRAITEFSSQVAPTANRPALLRPDFVEHFQQQVEVFIDSRGSSLEAAYFDALYAKRADPWRLATRWYETRKRSITTASLPLPRYERGLEIGCSIGMLTLDLAPRCDTLLAVDLAAGALDTARLRLREHPHVSFARLDASITFPAGRFDLIVVSEVGYYLSRRDLITLFDSIESHLEPGGTVLLCHWRHPVTDYPLTGDEVHEIMRSTTALSRTVQHEEVDFVLEVYGTDAVSVAEREGLTPE